MNFETLLKEKYGFSIKPQQRDAVLNTAGPALLLAVPGSGKTTAIALRCANLAMCRGAASENILTITHDHSTRDDLNARIRGIFGREFQKGLLVVTMVDFCSVVMKEYTALMGVQLPRQIEGCKRRLLRSLYAEINDGEYLPDNRLEEIIASISSAKHDMASAGKGGGDGTGKIHQITDAYDAYMNTNRCVDFDEVQVGALAALNQSPDLLERFRKRFRYINVDEAQEVSRLQLELLKKLAAPGDNLFLAGDGDQCLDRTACPSCINDFSRAYPQAGIFRMERNYRSTHVIVAAANRLIRHNGTHDMNAMNTGNEIGMPVEATVLVENGLLGNHLLSRLKSLPDPGEAAIIYRRDSSVATVIDALNRERIPFRLRDRNMHCFDHWVAQDILAYMALAQNPTDIAALKRIYRKLNTYISKEVFNQAASAMDDDPRINAWEALLYSSKISENTSARIRKLKEDMVNLPGMMPNAAINYILEKLEYGEYLKKVCGKGMYLKGLLQIVESLTAIASHTESHSQLLARIGELNKAMENAGKSTDQNAVMLAAARTTKGMEFKYVYIIDVYEGSFPSLEAISKNSDGNKQLMEEERRLFYVTVTRAGKYVELIYSRKINGIRMEPSRFIHELLHREKPRKAGSGKGSGRLPRNAQKQPPSGKSSVKRKPEVIRLTTQKPPLLELFDLKAGMPVEHKAFGRGIISSYDVKRNAVDIKFPGLGLKKFSASYCMSSGVIQIAGNDKLK